MKVINRENTVVFVGSEEECKNFLIEKGYSCNESNPFIYFKRIAGAIGSVKYIV